MTSLQRSDLAATGVARHEPGRTLPRLGANIKTTNTRRYLSIDILRAIAILLMIQVHFVEDFAAYISDKFSSPAYLYSLSGILGLIPAPIFTFLGGLSYSLWLEGQKRSGQSEDKIAKYSFRRGMFVFILGFAVNIFIQTLDDTFDWDILTFLGAASIIVATMRNWHPAILVAACVVIILAAPPLRELAHYENYWTNNIFRYQYDVKLKDIVFGFVVNGYFPLLPWLAYPLAGFITGKCFYPRDDEEDGSLPLLLPLIGSALIGFAVFAVLLEPYVPGWASDYYANELPDDLYPATTVFVLASLGAIMVSLWALNYVLDFKHRVAGTGPFFTFFRRYSNFALTAYVAHLAAHLWLIWAALALWPKPAIEAFLGASASVWTSLAASTGFIILFYFVIIFLERRKKYSLEYFLRWSCD